MKKLILVFIIIIAASTTTPVIAQTANSLASAKIVGALTLNNTQPLNFGTMSIPTGAVNVTYPTSGLRIATVPANILLIATEAGNAAHFTVSGAIGLHYKITLPADDLIKIKNGSIEMSIDNFTSRTTSVTGVDGIAGILNSSGTDDFIVGATLKLANAQQPGAYEGNFTVLVAYD